VVFLALCGTLPVTMSCLNPEQVNAAVGGLYPTAPGDTPFVLVRLINDTNASLDTVISIDQGSTVTRTIVVDDLTPGIRELGYLIPWPFLRVSLGALDSPFTPSITGTFGGGGSIAVPFGQPALAAGQQFDEGDTVIFRITGDIRTPSSVVVSSGLIDGATQTGPLSRADTFRTVELLLLNNAIGVP
jgi:hypothetical protein